MKSNPGARGCEKEVEKAVEAANLLIVLLSHNYLRKLNLADSGINSDSPIDMLIGADVYWKIVDGNIKKDDNSGLIAISSLLGWLISGPINDNDGKSVNLINSHVMKIECERSADKLLSSKLSNFWDLDTIGISENEVSVYDKFQEKIK